MRGVLEKAGHKVTCHDNVEKALDLVISHDVDAVIVSAAPADSLSLLRQLRLMQAGSPRRTPVLVVTDDDSPEAVETFGKYGARDVLTNPVTVPALLDAVADIHAAAQASTAPAEKATKAIPLELHGVFDPSVLDELSGLGMGPEFVREFVEQCLSDVDQGLEVFDLEGRIGNWTAVREALYSIKGVAGNVGLVGLADRAKDLLRLGDAVLEQQHAEHLAALQASATEGRRLLANR